MSSNKKCSGYTTTDLVLPLFIIILIDTQSINPDDPLPLLVPQIPQRPPQVLSHWYSLTIDPYIEASVRGISPFIRQSLDSQFFASRLAS